jgi:hypothetical protein
LVIMMGLKIVQDGALGWYVADLRDLQWYT